MPQFFKYIQTNTPCTTSMELAAIDWDPLWHVRFIGFIGLGATGPQGPRQAPQSDYVVHGLSCDDGYGARDKGCDQLHCLKSQLFVSSRN